MSEVLRYHGDRSYISLDLKADYGHFWFSFHSILYLLLEKAKGKWGLNVNVPVALSGGVCFRAL